MKHKINSVVVQAAKVMVAGWLVTLAVLLYLDLREPWEELSGYIPDGVYAPCQIVPLNIQYKRNYTPDIESIERTIIGPDRIRRTAESITVPGQNNAAPPSADGEATFYFKLPCVNMVPGEYKYVGVVEYQKHILPNTRIKVPPGDVRFTVGW